jgi:hypothetical protein
MKAECVFAMIEELRREIEDRFAAIRFLMTRIPEPPAQAGGDTLAADLASVDYTAPKPKRELSPAARARISKAQKKRWAKHRLAQQRTKA